MSMISFSYLILTTQTYKPSLQIFNSIHPNLHFTAETEQNNTIIYLDISIQKKMHTIYE
jgi:hypothetical protein